MLLEFTTHPLGESESVGDAVAAVVDLIDRSGLPYRLTPMSTVIEGEWDELMDLVRRCHALLRSRHARVVTTIHIDDRAGPGGRLQSKPDSIAARLGRPIRQ